MTDTKHTYRLAALLCLTLVLPATAQDGEQKKAPQRAKVGEQAPTFTLADTGGKQHDLSEYTKAGKVVVLEWFNPACPYVVNHHQKSSTMRDLYAKYKEQGVVWLAINATSGTTAQVNNVWISMNDLKYPILLDEGGKVRRLYDARRTPQMFVIDTKGVLRYKGAIDNNGLLNKSPEEITNYVAKAVQQLVDQETITADSTKPYGCPIKYAR